jgi:hypothetical protein
MQTQLLLDFLNKFPLLAGARLLPRAYAEKTSVFDVE